MALIDIEEYTKMQQKKREERHKKLLRENGDKAIKTIKKEIPKGKNLKEYLEYLRNSN